MKTQKVTLFHNPNCSKSREALELLLQRRVEVEIVEYLDDPPTREELIALIERSDASPADFVRAGDSAFAGLTMPEPATADAVAALLAQNPRVLQRPIALGAGGAVIGRPPQRVLEILSAGVGS